MHNILNEPIPADDDDNLAHVLGQATGAADATALAGVPLARDLALDACDPRRLQDA
jgi:hypothetical protein